MSNAVREELQKEAPFSEWETQRIQAHLEQLLANEQFAGSRRRQAFLRYVVEESLAGRGSAIKETNIAVDVFGRNPAFDSQDSSVVRVTGCEVRKRLARVYSSEPAPDIRIEVTPGCYQPAFYFADQPDEVEVPEPAPQPAILPAPAIAPSSAKAAKAMPRRHWFNVAAAAVVACLLIGVTSALLSGVLRPAPPLELLWRPFLNKERPVVISIATPTLLQLSPGKWLPLDPAAAVPVSDLVVLRDSYVGTGGAMGAARFSEQLTRRKQKFDLKFGSDVIFADLKESPSILIGVSALTQRLTHGARFQLQLAAEGIRIADMRQKDRAWQLPRRNYASPPRADGYSLITRLIHSDSGQPLLVIAGMDSHNTEAAVEFLTTNESFRLFAVSAPSDWPARNFQIVLHNIIYGNSAGSLSIVASEVW
jgi:hypothetical protein